MNDKEKKEKLPVQQVEKVEPEKIEEPKEVLFHRKNLKPGQKTYSHKYGYIRRDK